MKTKKFKMSLNKETVSNLNIREMGHAKGGADSETYCNTECIGTDPDTQGTICRTWIGECFTDLC
jgi:hypothetical protein